MRNLYFTKEGGKVKILIYGAGVIGSVFAGKLALCKYDVTVLARGRRLQEIRENGIVLQKPNSKTIETVHVKLIEQLAPTDIYDYILVVVQGTQIDDILPMLHQNKSKNIVLVVNTAKGYDEWVSQIGTDRLMLGFPSAGGERKDGKIYYFIGRGIQRIFQTTTFGEYNLKKTDRVKILINMFNKSGIPSVFCKDMDAWQKAHVALVTAIANALYGFECDNVKLGNSYADVKTMVRAIKEGRQVLRKCNIKPTPKKLYWLEMPTNILAIIFSLFLRTKLAETTMAKHCLTAKSEMLYLQNEFDILIKSSGIKTPAIDKLRNNLLVK